MAHIAANRQVRSRLKRRRDPKRAGHTFCAFGSFEYKKGSYGFGGVTGSGTTLIAAGSPSPVFRPEYADGGVIYFLGPAAAGASRKIESIPNAVSLVIESAPPSTLLAEDYVILYNLDPTMYGRRGIYSARSIIVPVPRLVSRQSPYSIAALKRLRRQHPSVTGEARNTERLGDLIPRTDFESDDWTGEPAGDETDWTQEK